MSRSLRILVADDDALMREYLAGLLSRLGHQVAVAGGGRQLLEQCRAAAPDLVITDIRMPDVDGLEAAAAINRERETPVILVSAHSDDDLRARAGRDYVMAYLTKPVKQADLQAAIDLAVLRFGHFQALRREAADLRQALEDRKLVERAKGAVMRRLHVDEPEAYRLLRGLASDRNWKLAELARRLLEADQVFEALEDAGAGR